MQFSNLGQVLAAQQITDGVAYNSSYTYNLGGALVNETYPDGSVVTNQYRADGQLAQITGLNGGVTKTYADTFAYNPAGAIQSLRIGNNKWESAQFNNRLQVTQLGLGNSLADTSIWKLNYDFGGPTENNGNIKSQTVTAPTGTFTQNFTYDSLNRLKTAGEVSGTTTNWTQAFTYDRYGNRIGFNQVKNGQTYNYTPTVDVNTNRFTTGQGYIYDLAGNLIGDSYGNQFFFNGDNKQREVRNSQNQTVGQYFYDGDGKRIKKITPTETTIFVYSVGKLVMELTATGSPQITPQTQYVGTDKLGSIRVMTDQAGNVISRRDFMPFGEDIQRTNYGIDNVRQKFTGYQKDTETGLDFAEARYYNNFHGRFTAVDPLLASGKSGNPQTFNRFVYSLNNPINLSDPSGMQVGSKVWAIRPTSDNSFSFQQFNSAAEMNKANSNNNTPFCQQNPSSCSTWSLWTKGEFFIYNDGSYRMGAHLENIGKVTSFSLDHPYAADSEWHGLVQTFYSGNAFSQEQLQILKNAFLKNSEVERGASDARQMMVDAGHAMPAIMPAFAEFGALRGGSATSQELATMSNAYEGNALLPVRSIAGYEVAGTYGRVGNTYNVNIWALYAKSGQTNRSMFSFVRALEGEAASSGAGQINILGTHVRNSNILSPLNIRRAQRLGYSFEQINQSTVRFTKDFKF